MRASRGFAEAIGILGAGEMELIGLVCFVAAFGAVIFLANRVMKDPVEDDEESGSAASAGNRPEEAKVAGPSAHELGHNATRQKTGGEPVEHTTDLQSLMSAVRQQAVELRGEHAQVASSLSLKLDVLTNRLATIEPLLAKAMEAAGKSDASVRLLTASNDDFKEKLAEAKRDLASYRPLAIKLQDEIRVARHHVAETDRRFAALDADHAKAQGARNELVQKMFSAELARQRMAEENAALAQKLNEQDFTIQTLLRETARLKSETVSLANDLQRAERELNAVAEKYAAELEAERRATGALNSLEAEFKQFQVDSASQIAQAEEREKALIEAVAKKEKQFCDSELKRSALDSKIDALTRTSHDLREDLQGQLDHIANLEASNRSLVDLVARHSAAEDQNGETAKAAPPLRAVPKLRAVPDSQPEQPPVPVPADRA
jgi:chromosome segregation ATPase